MNFNFLSFQDKQKYFIWALVVLVCIGGVIAWYQFFRADTISLLQGTVAAPPRDISLDFSVFDSPVFQELAGSSTDIAIPAIPNRPNPFLPN